MQNKDHLQLSTSRKCFDQRAIIAHDSVCRHKRVNGNKSICPSHGRTLYICDLDDVPIDVLGSLPEAGRGGNVVSARPTSWIAELC